MTPEGLPQDVVKLILTSIDSVEQLNVLLLLQSNPDRIWSHEEITRELRSTEKSIKKRLEDLYSRNVLSQTPEREGRHQFSPCSEKLAATIHQLAELYKTRPYTIIETIYSRPNEMLKALADAFNLKKDKEK